MEVTYPNKPALPTGHRDRPRPYSHGSPSRALLEFRRWSNRYRTALSHVYAATAGRHYAEKPQESAPSGFVYPTP
jgi:hypothetical protein